MATDTTTYVTRSTEDSLASEIDAYMIAQDIAGADVVAFDKERLGQHILWTLIYLTEP